MSVAIGYVTSLVEVWIEIRHPFAAPSDVCVTSLVEVWIEIHLRRLTDTITVRHFPCGSVDRNQQQQFTFPIDTCHFSCESIG